MNRRLPDIRVRLDRCHAFPRFAGRSFTVKLGAFVVLLLFLFAPVAAQKARAIKRIGYLTPTDSASALPAFRQGMLELGYIEAQNVTIEYRSAQGQFDQLPQIASELARLDLDVLVTVFTQATLAAKRAT